MYTTSAAPSMTGFTPMGANSASSKLSSLFGAGPIGSIANIIGSLIGGQQLRKGYQGLEEEIQGGIGQEKMSLAQALGLLSPFQTGGATAFQQSLGLLQQEQDPAAFINKQLAAFQQSPAQKATIQAGLEAVQNRLRSQGLSQSGAEQKALEEFAQQQTSGQQQQFLQNVLGLQSQRLRGLQGLAGLGLGAATTGAQGALQTGTNIADLLESLGMTRLGAAQAEAKGTQRIAGGLGGLISDLGSIFLK